MTPVTPMLRNTPENHATRADCLAMARDMIEVAEPPVVSDVEGNINMARVTMLQLFVHMTINTKDLGDGRVNQYSGRLADGFGVYPFNDVDHPVLEKSSGKFEDHPDTGLQTFFSPAGKQRFIVGDMHRVTENFFLASAHYFVHKLHNKLIDQGIAVDYADGKKKTLACTARVFLDIWKDHSGQETDREVYESASEAIGILGRSQRDYTVINTKEVAFAFMRWAHVLVRSTDQASEEDIFSREQGIVRNTPWEQLSDALDMTMPDIPQVAEAMTRMDHTGGERDVRLLTMTRFCEQGLASFEDVAAALGLASGVRADPTPTWLGILQETTEGRPGPVTTAILNACMYESLWHGDLLDISVGNHINDSLESVVGFVTSD